VLFKSALEQSGATKLFSDIGTKFVNSLNSDADEQKKAVELATTYEKQQNDIAANYSSLRDTRNSYYNDTVVPAQSETERLQAAASASYDSYSNIRNQFSNYVSQYDAVKAQYDGLQKPTGTSYYDWESGSTVTPDAPQEQLDEYRNFRRVLIDKIADAPVALFLPEQPGNVVSLKQWKEQNK